MIIYIQSQIKYSKQNIQISFYLKNKTESIVQLQPLIYIQKMNILQDVKQSQFHQPSKMSKSSSTNNTKKVLPSKSGNAYEVQMQIGIAYNQVMQAIKQNGYSREMKLPEDGIKSVQKLELIKRTVQFLINQAGKSQNGMKKQDKKLSPNSAIDQSNIISCVDCQNYQNNLQKLQNEVRQHIRLQQQLKIYQESMEQKIQQLKKEKTQHEKKFDDLKKKYDQQKHSSNGNSERMHKLEFQNQKFKAQIKQIKQSSVQNSKKIKGFQSRDKQNRMSQKQNRIDWGHRMSSINKKDEKQKVLPTHIDKNMANDRNMPNDRTDRKSVDKRGDSSDRWRMSGARSTKLINFNQKIIQEKNKQQRKKAIQSKFQYRR